MQFLQTSGIRTVMFGLTRTLSLILFVYKFPEREGSEDYASLSDAVENIYTGFTVYLGDGTFAGPIDLNGKDVTFIGNGRKILKSLELALPIFTAKMEIWHLANSRSVMDLHPMALQFMSLAVLRHWTTSPYLIMKRSMGVPYTFVSVR